MDTSVICLITGKKIIFSQEYFNKRAEEYGSVENLKKYFILKKAKNLLVRGYNVKEIRNILNVDNKNLLDENSQDVKNVVNYHVAQSSLIKKTVQTFDINKSDPDVAVFINNIKDLKL